MVNTEYEQWERECNSYKTYMINNQDSLREKYGDNFTKNFEENKAIVRNYVDVSSKKLRNTIAGYVTRLVKTKED